MHCHQSLFILVHVLSTSHHFHPSSSPVGSLSVGQLDENADASQAIFKPPPENWKRPGAAMHNLDEEHS